GRYEKQPVLVADDVEAGCTVAVGARRCDGISVAADVESVPCVIRGSTVRHSVFRAGKLDCKPMATGNMAVRGSHRFDGVVTVSGKQHTDRASVDGAVDDVIMASVKHDSCRRNLRIHIEILARDCLAVKIERAA